MTQHEPRQPHLSHGNSGLREEWLGRPDCVVIVTNGGGGTTTTTTINKVIITPAAAKVGAGPGKVGSDRETSPQQGRPSSPQSVWCSGYPPEVERNEEDEDDYSPS